MGDKPDLMDVITKHAVGEAAENIISVSREKVSASPWIQGFIVGLICAKFPVRLFLAGGTGFITGLFLEENFKLPDLKEQALSLLPEKKEK